MVKVTLQKNYIAMDFIFSDLIEASNFIEAVLTKSTEKIEVNISLFETNEGKASDE